ncbi:MAG TPA: biotin-dependent carboxyltransferase family protein [Candidatus Eremiobacteraceae bacterium]
MKNKVENGLTSRRTVRAIEAGMLTCVQDLGRRGAGWMGVSPCGAADWYSARAANRLVGNDDGRALIETTLSGTTLKISSDAIVAVSGADAPLAIGERVCEPWVAHAAPAGSLIVVGAARRGLRSYIALDGGLRVPEVFGSSSTDVTSGFGGRILERGDEFELGPDAKRTASLVGRRLPSLRLPTDALLRVLPGLDGRLTPSLLSNTYTVSARSSRQAMMLDGGRDGSAGAPSDIVSFGVTAGCVQIASDGAPMVLLVEHQTTGGYAVAACVIYADLPIVAQLRPGARVRFEMVSVEESEAALAERVSSLSGTGAGPQASTVRDNGFAERLTQGFFEGVEG